MDIGQTKTPYLRSSDVVTQVINREVRQFELQNRPQSFGQDTPKKNKALVPVAIAASLSAIFATMTLISLAKGKIKPDGKIAKLLAPIKNFDQKLNLGLTQVQNFNMFKPSTWKNLVKTMKYGPVDIVAMAGASTASGLVVGSVLDKKENRIHKKRESVAQLVGNIIFPITSVSLSNALMDKTVGKKIFGKVITNGDVMDTLSKVAKKGKVSVRMLKLVPAVAAFAVGVLGGNWVANKINRKFLHEEEKRCIKLSDFSGHIDDACSTIALVGKGMEKCEAVARVIPAALSIGGVMTAVADGSQEKHKACQH